PGTESISGRVPKYLDPRPGNYYHPAAPLAAFPAIHLAHRGRRQYRTRHLSCLAIESGQAAHPWPELRLELHQLQAHGQQHHEHRERATLPLDFESRPATTDAARLHVSVAVPVPRRARQAGRGRMVAQWISEPGFGDAAEHHAGEWHSNSHSQPPQDRTDR